LPPLDPSAPVAHAPLPHAEHAMVDPTAPELPPNHPGMPAGHGAMAGAADPHAAAEQATPGDIPFDERTVVAGVLKLDAKLKAKVKPGDVIFLVARGAPQGDTPGPVVAVQRVEAAAFPMPFQIDGRDAMMVGTQMKGPIYLSARVDKDGDAITKNPGDIVGTLNLKTLPAKGQTLLLDKEL
jgi:hypothetical protein